MPLSITSACFPVVRKHWLLYAWQIGKPDSTIKGQDLEGLRGWIRNAPQKAIATAQSQWRGLKEAKEGSIKNYVYKCASSVHAATVSTAPHSRTERSGTICRYAWSGHAWHSAKRKVSRQAASLLHACAGSLRACCLARTRQRRSSSSSLTRATARKFASCTLCDPAARPAGTMPPPLLAPPPHAPLSASLQPFKQRC